MNDQQIFALLLKTPDIRAVQISDVLDVDLADVSRSLREMVECGDVVSHKGTAPNGVSAMMYNLSEQFKGSKEYRALVALAEAAPAAQAPAPAPAPAPIVIPTFTDLPKAGSKADRAIAFVTKFGAATDDELRDALGLGRTDHVAAYITSAVKTGKLVKSQNGWILGDGRRPFDQPVTGKSKHGPVAQFAPTAQPEEETDLPAELVEQLSKPAQAQIKAERRAEPREPEPESLVQIEPVDRRAAPRTFRIAMWSDGALELQRDGWTIASLTRDECDQLAGFLARMAQAAS